MGGTFDSLSSLQLIPSDLANRLRGAVGFRNIAVHAYRSIDWAIVFAIATTRLTDFSDFARHISAAADLD